MGLIYDMFGKLIKSSEHMNYSDKMAMLKELKPRIEWKDIEVGKIYVIPKILYKQRKVVIVKEKTDTILRCKEVDENGKETVFVSTYLPTEVEMLFLVEQRDF